MRSDMRFVAALFVLGLITPAYAIQDEFGARFENIAPAALADDTNEMDMIAQGLQDIMPAAGNETAIAVEQTPDTQTETSAPKPADQPAQ